MAHVVVVVEQDPTDLTLWRYGLAGPDGCLRESRRLRHDPLTGCGGPVDPPDAHYPTAVLLVRGARGRQRVAWDVTGGDVPNEP